MKTFYNTTIILIHLIRPRQNIQQSSPLCLPWSYHFSKLFFAGQQNEKLGKVLKRTCFSFGKPTVPTDLIWINQCKAILSIGNSIFLISKIQSEGKKPKQNHRPWWVSCLLEKVLSHALAMFGIINKTTGKHTTCNACSVTLRLQWKGLTPFMRKAQVYSLLTRNARIIE